MALQITNADNKKVFQHNSTKLTYRSVKIQCGKSYLKQNSKNITRQSTSLQTPKKRTRTSWICGLPCSNAKVIASLAQKVAACKNKCESCGVSYKSREDRKLSQRFKKSNTWIACDKDDCDYWGHARCFNVAVPRKKEIQNIPFLCPTHMS